MEQTRSETKSEKGVVRHKEVDMGSGRDREGDTQGMVCLFKYV